MRQDLFTYKSNQFGHWPYVNDVMKVPKEKQVLVTSHQAHSFVRLEQSSQLVYLCTKWNKPLISTGVFFFKVIGAFTT